MDDAIARCVFSADEWAAIFDVLNGWGGGPPWQDAAAAMARSPQVAAKWHVDHQALAERLRGLPLAERAAIWEAAARFWIRGRGLPRDAALTTAGVSPRG